MVSGPQGPFDDYPAHGGSVKMLAMLPKQDGDPRRPYSWAVIDIGVLLLAIVPLGVVLVPAHWTSIWMDREFQGWMIAVANRLGWDRPLYVDGSHSPMPPLPFALELVVGGGSGTWLTESMLNFVFQALLLFGMYAALAACSQRPIALCATLAAAPIIFAIQKMAIHDSVAQCAAAWATMAVVRGMAPGADPARARWWLRGAALANAVCLLSKQSTAAGLTLGVVAAHLLADRSRPPSMGLARAAGHIGWMLASAAALVLAVSPLLSVRGLLEDVYLYGAEPKGGVKEAVRNLVRYAKQAAPELMVYGPVALALLWLGTRARSAGLPAAAPRRPYLMGASVLTALVVLGLALAPGPVDLTTWYAPLRWIGLPGAGRVLWTGLGLALVGAAWSLGRRSRTEGESQWVAMVVILVPTALAHNLSTMYLRWTYDNNPIIVLAMAWVAREAVAIVQRLGTPVRAVAHAALGIVMQLGAWMSLAPQLAVARQCTEPWPEVAHLRGARLRPTAGGMRELVRIVRELTAPGDSVLLLPEDPNVGAWLERPRPHLTSAIAFADQYWDRYVDEDVRRLSAAPPRVIVVGPRGIAPVFARLFGNRYWGVERLADRVARELLPRAYVLHVQQVIAFQRGTDRMDVYVRRDTP